MLQWIGELVVALVLIVIGRCLNGLAVVTPAETQGCECMAGPAIVEPRASWRAVFGPRLTFERGRGDKGGAGPR
jgi:hypothetical protein